MILGIEEPVATFASRLTWPEVAQQLGMTALIAPWFYYASWPVVRYFNKKIDCQDCEEEGERS